MKYYLIAGEASGDLHASNLMRALQQEDANAEFRFFGGDLMASCGGTLVKHYRDMAYMGFIPVLMNLDKVLANMRLCKQDIAAFRPDVVILIDYPGFDHLHNTYNLFCLYSPHDHFLLHKRNRRRLYDIVKEYPKC